MRVGDTKAGTLIGVDRFGNKYFENNEELPRAYSLPVATGLRYSYFAELTHSSADTMGGLQGARL